MPFAHRLLQALSGATALLLGAGLVAADTIELRDPEGDDNGPGGYVYPTDGAYQRGDFDITAVTLEYDDESVEISIEVGRRIEDPWHSADWNGNGFSLQFAQVYIDFDRADTAGHTRGLPGINVQFAADQGWNKVVLISPQPSSRLNTEISEKAGDMAADVVVPERTGARGTTLFARVPRSALSTTDPHQWGIQVVMQSNEGYPAAHDLLTRPVNEFEGPHRFGGGNDLNCDPHVIDMLAGAATGDAGEADQQHQALATFTCDGSEEGTWATIPLVYRAE